MDWKRLLKKFALPEHSPNAFSSRRNVVLDFGLGFGVSLLLLTVIILKNPFNNSFLNPISWSFSVSNTGVSSSTSSSSDLQNSTDFLQRNEDGMSQAKTHDENLHNESENASFPTKEDEISKKPHEEKKDANESFITKSEPLMKNTHNGTERVTETPKIKEENITDNGGNVISPGREERVSEKTHENHLSGKGKSEGFYNDSGSVKRLADSSGKCDIFDGRWVRDAGKPLYYPGSCPYIDRPGRCHLNGRPDDDFLKWKWQPNGCDMPSLKVTDFLERLRGKRLVFVGDSLNRNMWESLVCILLNGVKNKKRVYDVSGSKKFNTEGFYAFRFMDYNCSIDFVPSPFLVRISSSKGQNGLIETLRLDLMDPKTSIYRKADILVFNTGHWWTHEKPSRGEDYYQEGNHVYPKLEVLEAYKKALTTWARWVDKNIDSKRTRVFFRGYSLTHYSYRGSQWSSGGHCYKETEPIFNETYVGRYPSTMKVAENVLQEMKTPVLYLNITRLTDYRKDGHPSIYIKEHKSIEEKIAAQKSQDCSHWCLPGVPDTWNELLYASLLIA